MKESGHFIAGFRKRMNVKMSKTAGSSMKFSPQNYYFHRALTVTTCHFARCWNLSPFGRNSEWQNVFISLVGNNSRKLPLKPLSDTSSRLRAEWLFFFFLHLRSRTVPQKRKTVQISSATLRRSDKRSEHEKQSSKAIFIPPQFEVLKLKLHMDAIETRATRGD